MEPDTLALLRAGDLDAVFTRKIDDLRARAKLVRGTNSQQTDELVNDAYLKVRRTLPQKEWKSSAHWLAYMTCAMRCDLIDEHRRRERRPQEAMAADPVAPQPGPEEAFDLTDLLAYLERNLADAEQKEETQKAARVLHAYLFEGMSRPEIGEALDLELWEVDRLLHDGRELLQKLLRRELGLEGRP